MSMPGAFGHDWITDGARSEEDAADDGQGDWLDWTVARDAVVLGLSHHQQQTEKPGTYLSSKCRSRQGRHCDCVTGPTVQIGGVVRPNVGQREYCSCPCHHMPGNVRETLDALIHFQPLREHFLAALSRCVPSLPAQQQHGEGGAHE